MRVACKDPRELHFVIHVYINKVGYKIRWEPEGFPPTRANIPNLMMMEMMTAKEMMEVRT